MCISITSGSFGCIKFGHQNRTVGTLSKIIEDPLLHRPKVKVDFGSHEVYIHRVLIRMSVVTSESVQKAEIPPVRTLLQLSRSGRELVSNKKKRYFFEPRSVPDAYTVSMVLNEHTAGTGTGKKAEIPSLCSSLC